jgi:hypothetical protein
MTLLKKCCCVKIFWHIADGKLKLKQGVVET